MDKKYYREKNNSANVMIKQHFVRGFERGARRDHTPNIGLKRGVCQVTFETEDSMYFSLYSRERVRASYQEKVRDESRYQAVSFSLLLQICTHFCLPLRRESIGSKLNDIDQCIFAQMTNACCPVSHLLTQLPPGRNNNIRTFTRRQISVVGGGLYFAGSMNASVCII